MRTDHAVDRRRFLFGTAATALHLSGVLGAQTAASVELGSIDGSVGGNQFTPVQFLDYLSSIKLTWAMVSLNAATLQDEAAIKQIRDRMPRTALIMLSMCISICGRSGSPPRMQRMHFAPKICDAFSARAT